MRVLSGMQSSGKLHLGNYLGAMKRAKTTSLGPDLLTFILLAGASLGRRLTPFRGTAYARKYS